MRCPRCNANLVDDARFCGVCGAPLALPQDNATQTMPTALVPGDNEATLMAEFWPGAQPPGPQPPVSLASTMRQTPAPGPVQVTPSWSQQPQPVAYTQPPLAYRPGMAPGTMSSAGVLSAPVRRKRGGRVLFRVLLTLILLLGVLAGAWFFGVRPYLHNIVQTQLDQALNSAESQMILFQVALPSGGQVVHVDENSMNNYLSGRAVSPLQNLHATIAPDGLSLDFSAYNFTCAIIVVPIAVGGGLQVTHVRVQGVLGLVMSSEELTTALNSNFQSFGTQLTRKIQAVTLHEHEMDVQIQ